MATKKGCRCSPALRLDRGVVGKAEARDVGVELVELDAAEFDGMPKSAREVAAKLVAAVGGEGDPAFEERQENGEAVAGEEQPLD